MNNYIVDFENCSYEYTEVIGGKCASLGELCKLSNELDFCVAHGFAVTTLLYDEFIKNNKIENIIESILNNIDTTNLTELEYQSQKIREVILNGEFTKEQVNSVYFGYKKLCKKYNNIIEVATRSSSIAEDLSNASFAGQHDTYLNVIGIDNIMLNIKKCYASLFNGRAISYRKTHNVQISDIKMSVAVQKMVRSDIASAGVAFSLDPETGYNKAIVINSAFGLGELVVSGNVHPDEFIIDKRSLDIVDSDPIIMKKMGTKTNKIIYDGKYGIKEIATTFLEQHSLSLTDTQVLIIAKNVRNLENKYSELFKKEIGVDVEWAIDGKDNNVYIIQTRPETIHANDEKLEICKYKLEENGKLLTTGVSVGNKISTGKVKKLNNISEFEKFEKGDILVTDMTTPDWEPLMKISSGVITNKGGRTCHAAIVARELNINAIVGTGNVTTILNTYDEVTLSCADGEVGYIYDGILKYKINKILIDNDFKLPVNLMLNVGNPENSFVSSLIPNKGVGLARLEFIISNYIQVHPLALCNYPNVPNDLHDKIKNIMRNYTDGKDYFIKKLAQGMGKIASAFYPHDVIVRLSDFKSNEYRSMIGGELYEPIEENPMIGWRGASRYYSKEYEEAFALECEAIKYVRNVMKMENIVVMIPFCRTPEECKLVTHTMEKYGLKRGENKLKLFLMCEIPSNVIEADKFSPMVDGVSIGGNDLLQLTIGVDRDGDKISYLTNDKNLSYRRMISMAIKSYKENGVKVGFCGQQPSDSVEFCNFLINEGIDSISVTPDSALTTLHTLAKTK